MKEINKKVGRYIQLSKQFERSSLDIFGQEENSNLILTGSSSCTGINYYNIATGHIDHQETVKGESRAEKIRKQSEIKAKLAEDYDEYLQLQKDLGDYFSLLNKITQ